MIIHATVVRACLEAAHRPRRQTGVFGAAFPNELYTNAGKYTGAANYNLMVRHLHDIAGGADRHRAVDRPTSRTPRSGTSSASTWRTMNGVDGEYRTRLFHAIRDLTADSYGGWQPGHQHPGRRRPVRPAHRDPQALRPRRRQARRPRADRPRRERPRRRLLTRRSLVGNTGTARRLVAPGRCASGSAGSVSRCRSGRVPAACAKS